MDKARWKEKLFRERERESRVSVLQRELCHSESLDVREKRLPDASYTSAQVRQPFI